MSPKLAWIWPKDPRPGNPSHWPRYWRLRDVFTNRGPDIYVGKWDGQKTPRANWSRWPEKQPKAEETEEEGWSCCSSCVETERQQTPKRTGENRKKAARIPMSRIEEPRRGSTERYDFRTRRYMVPDRGTWSRVEYCCGREGPKHVIPQRYWDRDGAEYPAYNWHDIEYGAGCCRGR